MKSKIDIFTHMVKYFIGLCQPKRKMTNHESTDKANSQNIFPSKENLYSLGDQLVCSLSHVLSLVALQTDV